MRLRSHFFSPTTLKLLRFSACRPNLLAMSANATRSIPALKRVFRPKIAIPARVRLGIQRMSFALGAARLAFRSNQCFAIALTFGSQSCVSRLQMRDLRQPIPGGFSVSCETLAESFSFSDSVPWRPGSSKAHALVRFA